MKLVVAAKPSALVGLRSPCVWRLWSEAVPAVCCIRRVSQEDNMYYHRKWTACPPIHPPAELAFLCTHPFTTATFNCCKATSQFPASLVFQLRLQRCCGFLPSPSWIPRKCRGLSWLRCFTLQSQRDAAVYHNISPPPPPCSNIQYSATSLRSEAAVCSSASFSAW